MARLWGSRWFGSRKQWSGRRSRGKPACAQAHPLTLEALEARNLLSFLPPADFGAGQAPRSVAVGDFNGDGVADLAIADEANGSVSILLGNGDGSFQPAGSYATGTQAQSVAVGDFNGDGIPDLAVANWGNGTVSVLLGNGDGTFQSAVNYAVGLNPHDVAVGDVNGDGNLDLVVANYGSNSVDVLLGNGDGTFQNAMHFGTDRNPHGLAIGDFNGDGNLDLAVANNGSNTVSILLGNGDGTFSNPVQYVAGLAPTSVAVGDFQDNGVLDLVVTDIQSSSVSVLLGNGDGTFQSPVSYNSGLNTPCSVVVGDFNQDGALDLAVANQGSNTVSVLLGNNDGTFRPAENYRAGVGSWSLAVGDFNGDGYSDLAVADSASNNVSVLVNDGQWAWSVHTVAYWRFENGTADMPAVGANTILDSSGHGLNGTPINGPVYRTDVADNPIPQTGQANSLSLDFNGRNQRVFIPDDPRFKLTHSLTLEAYIQPRAVGPGQIIFRGDDRYSLDPYTLTVEANNTIEFHIENASGQFTEIAAPLPGLNQWLHVAGTLNDATGQMGLYINGVLVASAVTSFRPFADLDSRFQPGLGIGNVQSANYNEYFNGLIDEVRISDIALAPNQFLDAVPGSAPARPEPPATGRDEGRAPLAGEDFRGVFREPVPAALPPDHENDVGTTPSGARAESVAELLLRQQDWAYSPNRPAFTHSPERARTSGFTSGTHADGLDDLSLEILIGNVPD